MMLNIVILDGYSANPGDLSWEPLKELGTLTVYDRTPANEVVERAKEADVVLTNKVQMTAEVIKALPRLKYIGELATGFNNIDIRAAREQGIDVCNIPAYSTASVAQMVFAHILNITNRIGHYAEQNRQGRWSQSPDFVYWDTPLHELAGKTIGIVGLGNIGWKVAIIARDFGMDVFAMTSKNSADLPEGIQKTTLEGLLAVSDILTLHCPLTDSTREMNEKDVAEALRTGRLGAYGADVMCSEPPAADYPLLSAPNAYITPHIAWATYEARVRLVDIAIDNVKAFVGGAPINVVNA